jgi:hypothetical protein
MTTKNIKRRKRGGGPRALATSLSAATKTAFGKRGFADGAILKDWALIAGEHLAEHSQPEKISYRTGAGDNGTLHLRLDSGSMATELLHLEPILIERINGYFGFKAIARLKITQGPLPDTADKPAWTPRALNNSEQTGLAESLIEVDDEDLRRALKALGEAVIRRDVD